jgi:hypothetical protein
VSDIDLADSTVLVRRGKGSEGGFQTLQQHSNPLLDERTAISWWLANRLQFGRKGAARPKSGHPEDPVPESAKAVENGSATPAAAVTSEEIEQCTEIVKFPTLKIGANSANSVARLSPNSLISQQETKNNSPVTSNFTNGSDRLFPIGRTRFWQIVHGYAMAAGIPRRKCKTHMLKHTIAKHLVKAGHPLNEIQEWMGWTSIETMNWYTRADAEELGTRIGDSIRASVGLQPVKQGGLWTQENR